MCWNIPENTNPCFFKREKSNEGIIRRSSVIFTIIEDLMICQSTKTQIDIMKI